jgi:acyl-homoserine lactone synthase
MTTVHIITQANRYLYDDLLERSFRLRHQIFCEERGWEALRRPDSRDVDPYDLDDTVYLLALDGDRLVGGQRLRPTTQPHLLRDVFPHLADVKGIPEADDIWEWTRYFVIRERRTGRTDCRLLAAVQQFGLEEGLSHLQAVVEAWWLPRWQEAGFKIHPLGLPSLIENQWSLAVLVEISEESLERVKAFAGIKDNVLTRCGPQIPIIPHVRHAAAH